MDVVTLTLNLYSKLKICQKEHRAQTLIKRWIYVILRNMLKFYVIRKVDTPLISK